MQPPEEVKAEAEHDFELDENEQIDAGIKANQLGDECSEPQSEEEKKDSDEVAGEPTLT